MWSEAGSISSCSNNSALGGKILQRERERERENWEHYREKSGTLPPSSLALGGSMADVWNEAACWSPSGTLIKSALVSDILDA